MPTFTRDVAVDRFLDALLTLEPQQWSSLIERSVSTYPERRPFLEQIQGSVSASERKALDRHTKDTIRVPLVALAESNDINFARMMNPVYRGVYALQKREKIGVDAVREWFSQYERVGIHYNDMVGEDD